MNKILLFFILLVMVSCGAKKTFKRLDPSLYNTIKLHCYNGNDTVLSGDTLIIKLGIENLSDSSFYFYPHTPISIQTAYPQGMYVSPERLDVYYNAIIKDNNWELFDKLLSVDKKKERMEAFEELEKDSVLIKPHTRYNFTVSTVISYPVFHSSNNKKFIRLDFPGAINGIKYHPLCTDTLYINVGGKISTINIRELIENY